MLDSRGGCQLAAACVGTPLGLARCAGLFGEVCLTGLSQDRHREMNEYWASSPRRRSANPRQTPDPRADRPRPAGPRVQWALGPLRAGEARGLLILGGFFPARSPADARPVLRN